MGVAVPFRLYIELQILVVIELYFLFDIFSQLHDVKGENKSTALVRAT